MHKDGDDVADEDIPRVEWHKMTPTDYENTQELISQQEANGERQLGQNLAYHEAEEMSADGAKWITHTLHKMFPDTPPPADLGLGLGSPYGDLIFIQNPLVREENSPTGKLWSRHYHDAIGRTADRVSWLLRGGNKDYREAYRVLSERAKQHGESYGSAKRDLLMSVIMLVLGTDGQGTFKRFGTNWATDSSGKKREIVPNREKLDAYWTWFCDSVRIEALRDLLDRETLYPVETQDDTSIEDAKALAAFLDGDADPLQRALDENLGSPEVLRVLAAAIPLRAHSRRQVACLAYVVELSDDVIAATLSINNATVRSHRNNIKENVAAYLEAHPGS